MKIKSFGEWQKIFEVDELTEMKPPERFIQGLVSTMKAHPGVRPSRDPADYLNARMMNPKYKEGKWFREAANLQRKFAETSTQQKPSKSSIGRDVLVSPKKIGVGIKNPKEYVGEPEDATNTGTFYAYLKRDETCELWDFISQRKNQSYAQLLGSIIEDYYSWPEKSNSKKVLLDYINNDDDLNNLSLSKVLGSEPSWLLGASKKSVAKAVTAAGLLDMVPSLLSIGKEKTTKTNEALGAVASFIGLWALSDLLDASWSYVAYGDKEKIEDSTFISWLAPILPKTEGIWKEDPLKADYASAFNTMMMLIYDAWNLCMGQESYGNAGANPIRSFSKGSTNNYLTVFSSTYCKDDDLKQSFTSFMIKLNLACTKDQQTPSMFAACPFFYTSGKVVVFMEDSKKEVKMAPEEFLSWIRKNWKDYTVESQNRPDFYTAANRSGKRPLRFVKNSQKLVDGIDPTKPLNVSIYDRTGTSLQKKQLVSRLGNGITLIDVENELRNLWKPESSISIRSQKISKDVNSLVIDIKPESAEEDI